MKPEYEAKIKEKKLRLQEWQKSEVYLSRCAYFHFQSEKLCNIGQNFMRNKDFFSNCADSSVVRTVIGSDSSLHRGAYNPSPVYDLVVGRTTRGKILKHLSPKSKSYYLYGFDGQDKLRWIKRIYKGCLASTEYLLYAEKNIYGITLRSDGAIQSVTEERYGDSITYYNFALVISDGDNISPLSLHAECYCYDHIGLNKATMYSYSPILGWHSQREYLFEREDGYLSAYKTYDYFDYLEELSSSELQNLHVYQPLVMRKARFNIFAE